VDFWLTMSFYFVFGAFAAWVTLKDNGLELALGMHAANNIYASIFANYSKGALQTQAFFTTNELDALYNLIATLLSMLVFYTIFFRPGKTAKKPAAEAVLEQNK
jgi:membrane protease YdiL (CAAX protease family)